MMRKKKQINHDNVAEMHAHSHTPWGSVVPKNLMTLFFESITVCILIVYLRCYLVTRARSFQLKYVPEPSAQLYNKSTVVLF
jgi:hypothetical protein